ILWSKSYNLYYLFRASQLGSSIFTMHLSDINSFKLYSLIGSSFPFFSFDSFSNRFLDLGMFSICLVNLTNLEELFNVLSYFFISGLPIPLSRLYFISLNSLLFDRNILGLAFSS